MYFSVCFEDDPPSVTKPQAIHLFIFLQASWIAVDFDNWRDWANEEYDGKEEYDSYMDVSQATLLINTIWM